MTIFDQFDQDKSGKLEMDEIYQLFSENKVNLNYDDVEKIFQIIDDDASGALTKDEFKQFLLAKDSKDKFRTLMREIKETGKIRLQEQKTLSKLYTLRNLEKKKKIEEMAIKLKGELLKQEKSGFNLSDSESSSFCSESAEKQRKTCEIADKQVSIEINRQETNTALVSKDVTPP